MKISDSFIVAAPLQTVWNFLLDVERMGKCVPGVESLTALDENTYQGTLKVKVGPISTSFKGTVTLTEVEAPHRVAASVTGDDQASASAVKAVFESRLTAVAGGTQVDYDMDLNLRGRLAKFGSAVVTATAKKMTRQFTANIKAALED